MNWENKTVSRIGDPVWYGVHKSGLPIYVCPKAGYTSTYAVIATRYGAVDTTFEVNGTPLTVPEGIAHYLEHKLFENEDCDAFVRYAATGASANAYTSFGQTAYLFSSTENVTASLEILLDFVQNPYFTPENVEKERGIIGQEIRMCEDDPDRLAMFRLLQTMYEKHPVRVDIAGTVESIAQITPELLYDCYHTFYNLHNMVLVVSGRITVDEVETVADRTLKPAPPFTLKRQQPTEPETVSVHRVEEHMPVAIPLFYVGFKVPVASGVLHTADELMAAEVLLEILAGHSSPLYSRLMRDGLINESFGTGFFEGAGYASCLFSGESRDPDAVAEAICAELARLTAEGIDPERFTEEQHALYGRLLAGLNDVESCGDWLVDDHFYGRKPFELIDSVAGLSVEAVQKFLQEKVLTDRMVLSVVSPIAE